MNILYIHQHFAIPSGSTGTRSYEFARRWVKAGHKVTVITGHYDIGGVEYSNKPQVINGVEVRIAGTRYSNKQSFVRRVMSFFGFMIFSFFAGLRVKDVDVVYATSTPLTIGIPAMLLKLFKRKPYVFEVRDQWPQIPIELGYIKNKLLIRALLWLEKRIYKSASAVVGLSPGMSAGVKEVIGEDKLIETVPNSSDTEVFRPDIDGSDIRKKHGWENKFVLMHFGAMGKANGLEFLVDVAERLKGNNGIHFVIIGDGATRQSVLDRVNKLGLKNIELLGSIPKTILPQYVAACDVSTVVFADYPILEHNSANKFFDSLSAGKPVLLNYSGWQRDAIEKVEAGYGCRQCDIGEFIEKVNFLFENKELLGKLGSNARSLAETEFSRDKLASKVLNVIESASK